MLDLHIIERGHDIPVVALPGLLGRRRAARMVGDTIEELIALMDRLDGDPDLEDGHDAEADQEARDVSWAEWTPRQRGALVIGGTNSTEDDEDDDPREATWPESVFAREYPLAPDDAEEDDDAGGNVTDELHDDDDPAGGNNAEDDFDLRDVGFGRDGPGCELSDPGGTELAHYK